MICGLFRFARAATAVAADTFLAPNASAFGVTDLAGSFVQDAGKIRMTRPIAFSGFEHAAPGARVRFQIYNPDHSKLVVKLAYTGLVTRNDVYNDVGSIFVDGAPYSDFAGPAGWTSGNPHPIGNIDVPLVVGVGTHVVEVIMPYSASVDFKGIEYPSGSIVSAAPPRPTTRGLFLPDSISQGFNSSMIRKHWTFLLAEAKGAQHLNLGYGGREMVAGDGTVAGGFGADWVIDMAGANNFIANGQSTTTYKNNYKLRLGNFRTATAAAGKPNATYYAVTSFDMPAALGGGGYAGNSPALESFRGATRTAVTEQADAHVVLIEGLGAGMPTGLSNFPDGVHSGDLGSAALAPALAGQIE